MEQGSQFHGQHCFDLIPAILDASPTATRGMPAPPPHTPVRSGTCVPPVCLQVMGTWMFPYSTSRSPQQTTPSSTPCDAPLLAARALSHCMPASMPPVVGSPAKAGRPPREQMCINLLVTSSSTVLLIGEAPGNPLAMHAAAATLCSPCPCLGLPYWHAGSSAASPIALARPSSLPPLTAQGKLLRWAESAWASVCGCMGVQPWDSTCVGMCVCGLE